MMLKRLSTTVPTSEKQNAGGTAVGEHSSPLDDVALERSGLEAGTGGEDQAFSGDRCAAAKATEDSTPGGTSGMTADAAATDLAHLPFELVEMIFKLIHPDPQQMPTPFQLLHVSRRWRNLVLSMPTIWQDTEVNRVPGNGADTTWDIGRPYRFLSRLGKLKKRLYVRGTCAELPSGCLRDLEIEIDDWQYEENAALWRIFQNHLKKSKASLKGLKVTAGSSGKPLFYSQRRSAACGFVIVALQCTQLAELELSLAQLLSGLDKMIDRTLCTPLHSLTLDCLGNLPHDDTEGRLCFIRRCAQLRSLTLRNAWGIGSWRTAPFLLALLAACANTLVELDTSGCVNLLIDLRRSEGPRVFQRLRRFRFIATECGTDYSHFTRPTHRGDLDGMAFPSLETIEAPADVIAAFPCVPAHVRLRLDDEHKAAEDCKTFINWLLSLNGDGQSIRSLTILVSLQPRVDDELDGIILAALMPSRAKVVACPNLTAIKIVIRPASTRRSSSQSAAPCVVTLHDGPPPQNPSRQYWELNMFDAQCLWTIEQDRRALSQGLPLLDEWGQTIIAPPSAAASTDRATVPGQGDRTGEATWPPCQALTSVEIEGGYVHPDLWDAMKKSLCHFKVTPDPDEMKKLP